MRDVGRYWGVPGIWALFAGFGITSLVAGVFAPSPRSFLIALGVTGLIAGALTYLVTPQQFVRSSIVERLHSVLIANVASDIHCEERQIEQMYVPYSESEPGNGSVRLLASCQGDDQISGVLVYPTGDGLLAEFDANAVQDLSDSPAELAHQIADSLENGLELVGNASATAAPSTQEATVKITGDVIGSIGRFDDPVTSFVGSAFASGLGQPVTVETDNHGNNSFTISCQWRDIDWTEDERDAIEASMTGSD